MNASTDERHTVKKHKKAILQLLISAYGISRCSRGVMDACEANDSPAILSFGSGFLQNTDIDHFASVLLSYAKSSKLPLVVHWDHGRSF